MGFLSKLFNIVPKNERTGITLVGDTAWEIKRKEKNYDTFLITLIEYLPHDSVIYIEGDSIASEVKRYYSEHQLSNIVKVQINTIWPRPHFYHIAANRENIEKMAWFYNNYAEPEVCDHIVIYHNGKVLFHGHDFYCPIVYFSSDLSEIIIKEFCTKANCAYTLIKAYKK